MLPSAPFTHACASMICVGVGLVDCCVNLMDVGEPSPTRLFVMMAPGNGSRGLGGKLPRPVMVNSPNGLAKLAPLGQV